MANLPVNISTRTASTAVEDADLFGLYKTATGLWGKLTGAVMRDQLLNRLTSLGDFASGGSIGACDAWEIANVAQTTAWKALTIDAPTNLLSQQKVIRNTGTAGFFMYGRYIPPGGAHIFTYVPSVGWRRTAAGPQRILQTSVNITAPTDTNKNAMLSFSIPPDFIGENGQVLIWYAITMTNNANAKTIALDVYDQTTTVAVTAANLANNTIARNQFSIMNMNSKTAQQFLLANMPPSYASFSTAWKDIKTQNQTDWTLSVTKATAGDSMIMVSATVDIIRFD